jgi:hypothetical protein
LNPAALRIGRNSPEPRLHIFNTVGGFLRPEFRLLINPLNDLPDHSHGNDAYGVLMLRRIFAYLKTGDPDA